MPRRAHISGWMIAIRFSMPISSLAWCCVNHGDVAASVAKPCAPVVVRQAPADLDAMLDRRDEVTDGQSRRSRCTPVPRDRVAPYRPVEAVALVDGQWRSTFSTYGPCQCVEVALHLRIRIEPGDRQFVLRAPAPQPQSLRLNFVGGAGRRTYADEPRFTVPRDRRSCFAMLGPGGVGGFLAAALDRAAVPLVVVAASTRRS